MTMLSLILSDDLAKASQEIAKRLGISRTEFIRQAIAHEVINFQTRLEQEAMAKNFAAMKKSKSYLNESKTIIENLTDDLFNEEDNWWSKTK